MSREAAKPRREMHKVGFRFSVFGGRAADGSPRVRVVVAGVARTREVGISRVR
ncbi:MAG: hypothetical protein ACK524_10265 [Planctomyces sp.]